MTTVRDDVAYVGQLGQRLVVNARVRTNGVWSTGAFYTLVYVQTSVRAGDYVALSRGYMGSEFIGSGYSSAHYELMMTMEWVPSTSKFKLFYNDHDNNDVERSGWLRVDGDEEFDRDEDESDATPFLMSTTDPAGYGSNNTLLAGVRYTMFTSTLSSGQIKVHNTHSKAVSGSNNSAYLGLQSVDGGGSEMITLDNIQWSFVPATPYYTANNSNNFVPSVVPFPLAVSQCVYLQGVQGYGTSDMCQNWQSYSGFTNVDNIQEVRYFYSQNRSCGEGYSFINDFLGNTVVVGSSIGTSCDCNYNSGAFWCDGYIPPDLPVENPPGEGDNPPVENPPDNPVEEPPIENPPGDIPPIEEPPGDIPPITEPPDDPVEPVETGIMSKWWFWGLLILVFLIVIVIVAVIVIASRKPRP